ncbi:MAG: hypothetical protein O3B24_06450, partial [Verrucomicrobia bacterium]|nr:hypothetical protein [Verrucomicrobiota bacterium]
DERALVTHGVHYRKFADREPRGYLVEKSSMQKLGDYTVRTLATPITVVIDGTAIAIYLWASGGYPGLAM